jgi:hypothetical protein
MLLKYSDVMGRASKEFFDNSIKKEVPKSFLNFYGVDRLLADKISNILKDKGADDALNLIYQNGLELFISKFRGKQILWVGKQQKRDWEENEDE